MTKRIRIYGIVQGVGFRPTVSRHAIKHGICGSVCNFGPYVEVIAQGSEASLYEFIEAVKNKSPKRAIILKMDVTDFSQAPVYDSFEIIESEKTTGNIFVSPDIAICEECKKELFDPNNRRYLHPFINCTCCGPRLTILDSMPYDRIRTSMKEFLMCPECEKEYTTPVDRRYDAQPVCCNKCGPSVYLMHDKERNREAISKARKIISEGGIVAVKGIGGFHLCCDATNESAVNLLRKRKNRPVKPFAVMLKDYAAVLRECIVLDGEEEIINGHQKPILLLEKKTGGKICDAVAPGNPYIGVMLPYAPVQLLLFTYDDEIKMPDALVMTSGNVSGAPICREDTDVEQQILKFCDAVLSHDRKIRIRADDTVMSFYHGAPYMIRRSRGYAPLPVMLSENLNGKVLAAGGELKNTFCIASNNLFYLSPYIGDMADVRTMHAFTETVKRMEELLETKPDLVVCDLHPGYFTTLQAEKTGLPVLKVQHHYAHILSCMAENNYLKPVLGVSFDGTGFGTDHTIWGGELLLCDVHGFQRLGSIAPFHQVGGDSSSRDGYKIAAAMIASLYQEEEALRIIQKLGLCTEQEAKLIQRMAKKKFNTVTSTSAGRLFDAVSAILSLCKHSTFEGEAAMKLQFAAMKNQDSVSLPEFNTNGGMPTDLLVKELIQRKLDGADVNLLAFLFHEVLAEMVTRAVVLEARKRMIFHVALSGGVFQNLLFLDLCKTKMEKEGLTVLIHSLVPPNDGGIALGQAVAGMFYKNEEK